VELWGFEPQASCMPCTLQPSPGVAGRRLAWRSPAASVAVCGLAWPGVAARWLPAWLPELFSAAKCLRNMQPPGRVRCLAARASGALCSGGSCRPPPRSIGCGSRLAVGLSRNVQAGEGADPPRDCQVKRGRCHMHTERTAVLHRRLLGHRRQARADTRILHARCRISV